MRWPRLSRLSTALLLLALAACSPRSDKPRPSASASAPAPQAPLPQPPASARPSLTDAERDAVLFTHWRAEHGPAVDAFAAFLVQQKVAEVVPMYQLLRSASMWKECHADPFEIPPQEEWPKVRDLLVLVRELQARGVLPAVEVVSAYRDPRLNRCAGGAAKSSHTRFAIDIAPLSPQAGSRLCRFWREEGKAWDMGVSRYPTGRIHIDRTGWRTWGASYKRASSYCLEP